LIVQSIFFFNGGSDTLKNLHPGLLIFKSFFGVEEVLIKTPELCPKSLESCDFFFGVGSSYDILTERMDDGSIMSVDGGTVYPDSINLGEFETVRALI